MKEVKKKYGRNYKKVICSWSRPIFRLVIHRLYLRFFCNFKPFCGLINGVLLRREHVYTNCTSLCSNGFICSSLLLFHKLQTYYKAPVRSTQRYHLTMMNPASRIIFLLFVVRLSYSVELGSRQTYGYV